MNTADQSMREVKQRRVDHPVLYQPGWSGVDHWYERAINEIGKQGIVIPGGSRILEQRKLLSEVAKNPRLNGPLHDAMPSVTMAFSDIVQIKAILDVKERRPRDALLPDRLREALRDAVAPNNDMSRPTPGRDAQFELFALACLKDEYGPRLRPPPGPDIEIDTPDGRYVVEAKRLRSVRALEDRSRKARDQIDISKTQGILATDLTLLFAKDDIEVTDNINSAGQHLGERMKGFVAHYADRILTSPRMIAWSLFAHSMYFVEGNLVGPVSLWCHTNLCAENDPRWHLAEQFFAVPSDYTNI